MVALWLAALAGASAPAGNVAPAITATVAARGETAPVGTANDDAADDPAIWRNARRPGASLIVGTDKKAGLYVYGLDGKVRDFVAAGRVNNVDLIDMGRRGVIVIASDRNDEARAKLQIYRLDTRRGRLARIGEVSGGDGEAYGICLMKRGPALTAFSIVKDGRIYRIALDLGATNISGNIMQTYRLATQTEGCVADARSDTLFVGEEDRGIWAFDLAPNASNPRLVAPVGTGQLVADVEGLALIAVGRRGGYLVASSQGDNAYALYRLPDLVPAGRFRIVSGTLGATEETDGIALAPGRFSRLYPDGLFVAQDGQNAPYAQNFKLVSWRDVMRATSPAR